MNFLVQTLMVLSLLLPFCYSECDGKRNVQPVIRVAPTFVRSVDNGSLYHLAHADDVIRIVVVRGDPFSQGFAIGSLLKDDIKSSMEHLLDSFKLQIKQYLSFLPEWALNGLFRLLEKLFNLCLSITWILTRPFTPSRIFEELKGAAAGSGIPYMDLVRVSMFPELIKAACSLVGAWGSATVDGNVYFLRALDWDVDSYVTKHPTIVVYHPADGDHSYVYANIGYAGLFGSFTAVNEKGLAIGEKVWWSPLKSENVKMTRAGKPWHYVIRDVAQYSQTLSQATNMLQETSRTCAIHLGIVTKSDNSYRGIHYSYNKMIPYDDKNYTLNNDVHPMIEGVHYWDKHPQPTIDRCLGGLLQKKRRNIDPEFLFREAAALHRTGNCQVVVFDMNRMEMYLSFSTYKPRVEAYDKPMFYVDLNNLFHELMP